MWYQSPTWPWHMLATLDIEHNPLALSLEIGKGIYQIDARFARSLNILLILHQCYGAY
jgi:hypothetical protein